MSLEKKKKKNTRQVPQAPQVLQVYIPKNISCRNKSKTTSSPTSPAVVLNLVKDFLVLQVVLQVLLPTLFHQNGPTLRS